MIGPGWLREMVSQAVRPESFTHGTSQQRQHWLGTGVYGYYGETGTWFAADGNIVSAATY